MMIRHHEICLLAVTYAALAALSIGCTNTKLPAKEQDRAASLWDCRGNSLGEWECSGYSTRASMPAQASAAPAIPQTTATTVTGQAEVTPAPGDTEYGSSPAPQGETTTVTAHTPAATVTTVREENTRQRLLGFPPHYYAVQLLAAKLDSSITTYRNSYPEIHAESVWVDYNGNRFQLLILGVYPSVSEARQAVAELPVSPEPAPWIRPMAPLQTFL